MKFYDEVWQLQHNLRDIGVHNNFNKTGLHISQCGNRRSGMKGMVNPIIVGLEIQSLRPDGPTNTYVVTNPSSHYRDRYHRF